ncbi:MAG: ACT domain-containing protein [Planctomycetota bacterium]
MSNIPTRLRPLPELFAIVKLPSDAVIPTWATKCEFSSITRTSDELSIVAPVFNVPEQYAKNENQKWRAFRFVGTLDFSLVGVIAKVSECLAASQISVFVISTYDTDYVLVPTEQFELAKKALVTVGFHWDANEDCG